MGGRDGEEQALPQFFTAAGVVQVGADFASDRAHGGKELVFHFRRQVLVGEVDQGFLIGEDFPQAVCPVLVERAEGAFQLAQGLAALRFGFGRNEVVHGFGFEQVHAVIEKAAPGEFARFGWAQAGLGQGVRHAVDDRPAAVEVEFGAVLTGIGAGAGEPQDEGVVEHGTEGSRQRRTQRGMAGRGKGAAAEGGDGGAGIGTAAGGDVTAMAARAEPEARAKIVSVITGVCMNLTGGRT